MLTVTTKLPQESKVPQTSLFQSSSSLEKIVREAGKHCAKSCKIQKAERGENEKKYSVVFQ